MLIKIILRRLHIRIVRATTTFRYLYAFELLPQVRHLETRCIVGILMLPLLDFFMGRDDNAWAYQSILDFNRPHDYGAANILAAKRGVEYRSTPVLNYDVIPIRLRRKIL